MASQARHRRFFIACGVLLILAISTVRSHYCEPDNAVDRQLLTDLLAVYGPGYVRPVLDEKTSIRVDYRLLIHELISLSTRDEAIHINAYLRQSWRDEFLQWEPSEYGNTSEIFVSVARIWQPDVTLIRNLNANGFEVMKGTLARVEPDGQVTWLTPTFLTGSCSVDITYFPFDTQRCEMSFSSWSFSIDKVDLHVATGPDAEQTHFAENGVWELLDVETSRTIEDFGSDGGGVFPKISYTFVFRRISSFYTLNIITPFVFLSFLAGLGFILPPDASDGKISVVITTMVTLFVFLQIVGSVMPPTGNAPILASYFIAIIVLVCFYLVLVIIIYYLKCNTSRPPRWFRRLVLTYLAKAVLLYDEDIAGDATPTTSEDKGEEATTETNDSGEVTSAEPVKQRPLQIPASLLNDVSFFRNNIEMKGAAGVGNGQWVHASRVIDRSFIFITTILWVVLTAVLLTSSVEK